LNSVYSEAAISFRVFNLIFGCLCLLTWYKCWAFIRDEPYRKHGTGTSINMTVFMSLCMIVFLALAVAIDKEYKIGKTGCILVIGFEIYQLMTVFSWFVIRVVTLDNSLKMYHWPTFRLTKCSLFVYTTPGIISAVVCGVLHSDDSYLLMETAMTNSSRTCTLISCDINFITQTRALIGCLVVLPMLVIAIAYAVQHVRCVMVANRAWTTQNLTLCQIIIDIWRRRLFIRGMLYFLTLGCLIVLTMVMVFTAKENKRSVKIIYSTVASSIILVTFINSTILSEVEWDIFHTFKTWWRNRVSHE